MMASLSHDLVPRNDCRLPRWKHFGVSGAAKLVEFLVAVLKVPAHQHGQGAIQDVPDGKLMTEVGDFRKDGSILPDDQLLDLFGNAPMTSQSIADVRTTGMCKQEPAADTHEAAAEAGRAVLIGEIGKLKKQSIQLGSRKALVGNLEAPTKFKEGLYTKLNGASFGRPLCKKWQQMSVALGNRRHDRDANTRLHEGPNAPLARAKSTG